MIKSRPAAKQPGAFPALCLFLLLHDLEPVAPLSGPHWAHFLLLQSKSEMVPHWDMAGRSELAAIGNLAPHESLLLLQECSEMGCRGTPVYHPFCYL